MIHKVDPTQVRVTDSDVATWLLFYLETHGAEVKLHADRSVGVNLDGVPGLNAETVNRWAPVISTMLPKFRTILLARQQWAESASR